MSDPNKLAGKDASMLVRAFAEGYVGSMRAVSRQVLHHFSKV